MQKYLNQTQVPLSVAVYLATDHYDRQPGAISATSLIKPVRQQILAGRIMADSKEFHTEILSVVKSRMGSAIHDAVEKAWVGGHYREAMKALGYPQSVIDRIVVNAPDDYQKQPGDIMVYMEKRTSREIDGKVISGKFDFVADGVLEDFKSTSTFTYTKQTNVEDYKLQGSIYRWLNPDIITDSTMAIRYFFTDWSQFKANTEQGYPPRAVESQLIPLLDLHDTEDYIRSRLALYAQNQNKDERDLPHCTDEELWRKETVWKYYKNPSNKKRSTKNFDNPGDAYQRLAEDGHVGEVVEVKGEVVACKYCPAFAICTQKDQLILAGDLVL